MMGKYRHISILQKKTPIRLTGWLIFVGSLALFVATAGGHFYTSDAGCMYQVTRNILEGNGFVTDRSYNPGCIGKDHRPYAPFGIGMSLAFIPFDLAGRGIAEVIPSLRKSADFLSLSFASMINTFVTAWMVCLVLACCLCLGVRPRIAFIGAISFGFASMAWPYAKQPWNVQLASALQLGCILWLLRSDSASQWRDRVSALFKAGFMLAGGVIVRTPTVIMLPATLAYVFRTRILPPPPTHTRTHARKHKAPSHKQYHSCCRFSSAV